MELEFQTGAFLLLIAAVVAMLTRRLHRVLPARLRKLGFILGQGGGGRRFVSFSVNARKAR